MRIISFFLLYFSCLSLSAQNIKVEFDKKHDVTKYKTFRFGDSQIAINDKEDQKKVPRQQFDAWVKNGITRELEYKGLSRVDSLADLVVSYAMISSDRNDVSVTGPLGMTPNSSDRVFNREYHEIDLIIDVNNRNNFLVWRINSTAQLNTTEAERTIDQIVEKGFKKFRKSAKKK